MPGVNAQNSFLQPLLASTAKATPNLEVFAAIWLASFTTLATSLKVPPAPNHSSFSPIFPEDEQQRSCKYFANVSGGLRENRCAEHMHVGSMFHRL